MDSPQAMEGAEACTPLILQPDPAGVWYVAHTRARNEKALAGDLGKLRIHNYLPLMPRVTRSPVTRRVSRSLVPVFPGYVFFFAAPEQRYLALRTNRIARVLEVPDQTQLIAELRQVDLLVASGRTLEVANTLKAGEWGRIVAGPLQGLEGVVERVSGQCRLHMNVTILGQSVNVEVDSGNVERIDPPSVAPGGRR